MRLISISLLAKLEIRHRLILAHWEEDRTARAFATKRNAPLQSSTSSCIHSCIAFDKMAARSGQCIITAGIVRIASGN